MSAAPDGTPQTVDEVIAELARRYGETLPRAADLVPDSLLRILWELPVTIEQNPPAPLLFKASATAPLPLQPGFAGTVLVYASQDPNVIPTLSN